MIYKKYNLKMFIKCLKRLGHTKKRKFKITVSNKYHHYEPEITLHEVFTPGSFQHESLNYF